MKKSFIKKYYIILGFLFLIGGLFLSFRTILAWTNPVWISPPDNYNYSVVYNKSLTQNLTAQFNGRLIIDASSTDIGLFILNTHNNDPEINIGASTTDNNRWIIRNNIDSNQLSFGTNVFDHLLTLNPDGKVVLSASTPTEQLSLSSLGLAHTTSDNSSGAIYKNNALFIKDLQHSYYSMATEEGYNFFGYKASENVAGYNLVLGAYALEHDDYMHNSVVIGYRAFNKSISADAGMMIGAEAARRMYPSFLNIGIGSGVFSGINPTVTPKQSANLAIGHQTMASSTNGGFTLAIGAYALHDTLFEDVDVYERNFAVGPYALYRTGSSSKANVAIGYYSLSSPLNTGAASYNVAIGNRAGYADKQEGARFNVIIGSENYVSKGDYNSFIGYRALGNFYDSDFNVVFGANNFQNLVKSNDNVVLGSEIGFYNTGITKISSTTILGYGALSNLKQATSSVFIGAMAGYNIINTYNDVVIGDSALKFASSSNNNVVVGYEAGIGVENINKSVLIGAKAMTKFATSTNEIVIGYNAVGLGPNTVVVGNDNIATTALWGYVGIGTSNPTERLYVDGDMIVEEDAYAQSFQISSDKRLKTNIQTIQNALEKVKKLRGVEFNWKNESANSKKHLGLIAQEVEKVFPEAVSTGKNGYKTVEYANLVAPLIEAIKEQQKEIEKRQARIEKLKKELGN